MKQWNIIGTGSFDNLQYKEDVPKPEYGDKEVLVKRSSFAFEKGKRPLTKPRFKSRAPPSTTAT